MNPLLAAGRADIDALCRRFRVQRLDVFGSAAREADFDPVRSDVDLLVRYDPSHAPALAEFLALRDALEVLFGRSVDLVMEGAIRNPFVQAGVAADRVPLYAS